MTPAVPIGTKIRLRSSAGIRGGVIGTVVGVPSPSSGFGTAQWVEVEHPALVPGGPTRILVHVDDLDVVTLDEGGRMY